MKEPVILNIYPNPFTQNFTVEYSGAVKLTIEVMDVLGKVISTQYGAAKDKIDLEMHDAPSGIYLVKIITEQNTMMRKVIKN